MQKEVRNYLKALVGSDLVKEAREELELTADYAALTPIALAHTSSPEKAAGIGVFDHALIIKLHRAYCALTLADFEGRVPSATMMFINETASLMQRFAFLMWIDLDDDVDNHNYWTASTLILDEVFDRFRVLEGMWEQRTDDLGLGKLAAPAKR